MGAPRFDFTPYLDRWDLTVDGAPLTTRSADLLPVRWRGRPSMLKIAHDEDERRGNALMAWWDGVGSAPVLDRDGAAVLIERATGSGSLDAMARGNEDDGACRILCAVAARLHATRPPPAPSGLVPLACWFRDLRPAAARYGGILARCADMAYDLLAAQQDVVVLHGDIHHNNVLDFGHDGWLAIDPKGLVGERTFDFANIFANPDRDCPTPPVAVVPGRFHRRLDIVSEAARLDRTRLLQWIFVWTGLSAAWLLADGDPATIDLKIAELAAAELGLDLSI